MNNQERIYQEYERLCQVADRADQEVMRTIRECQTIQREGHIKSTMRARAIHERRAQEYYDQNTKVILGCMFQHNGEAVYTHWEESK